MSYTFWSARSLWWGWAWRNDFIGVTWIKRRSEEVWGGGDVWLDLIKRLLHRDDATRFGAFFLTSPKPRGSGLFSLFIHPESGLGLALIVWMCTCSKFIYCISATSFALAPYPWIRWDELLMLLWLLHSEVCGACDEIGHVWWHGEMIVGVRDFVSKETSRDVRRVCDWNLRGHCSGILSNLSM